MPQDAAVTPVPLAEYSIKAELVDAIYRYLGQRPAAEVEQMRAYLSQSVMLQQEKAALEKLAAAAPAKNKK